ncbi:MAG TPA: aminotransferase class I/II-fold pyridoxal phosphate-dependent enzyme [Thermoanaerobaculia bacterium]|nr:aminotransferase class I/II-fold pyridoxal phosphate-dependent enzyme [Thermoanaerobaculia bacterium]
MTGEAPRHPLELSADTMRSLVELALEKIIEHLESLPSQPAADTESAAALARSLAESLPSDGSSYEELLDLIFDRLVRKTFNTAGPGYLAYIPGGGIFHAALADLIAGSINRYVGVWAAAPALVQLETNVVRWFCEIIGYPAGSGGILTSGGSLANFTAVVAARTDRLPENFLSGTIYASDQIHHSVLKAASLAGFPLRNVRQVPADGRWRIRLDKLAAAIEADRGAGLHPFLIVASAGTTNTGAVDDLDALADLAGHQSMWLHVDAAYGGFFMLTARGRAAMRGIERADSITLDPHKGLFLPYGNGSLLVRRTATLRAAHSVRADYMPPIQEGESEFVDFCEISPELSREFRGLRVWLPIRMHGIGPFRDELEEKLDLAQWATAQLRTIEGIEIVAEPQLSIVAFRFVRPGEDPARTDERNREILAGVNARQRVHLTGTMLGGAFVLRICVLSFRTHRDRVAMAIEDLREAAAETGP